MILSPDIRAVAESPKGKRFRDTIGRRLSQRREAIYARFDRAAQAEYSRHFAKIAALDKERDAALGAARQAYHQAEQDFFRRELGE